MKSLIYIILFVVLLIYINNHSKKLTKEDFTDSYQATDPYDLVNINAPKPFSIEDLYDFVVPYNENPSNTTELNNWILKNSDYSDIFNGQDIGGDQINNILNLPKTKVFLDKAMTKIDVQKPSNERNLVDAHKQQKIGELIPEIKPILENNLYPIEIKYENLKYNLLGYVYNTAYRQYYLLYETVNSQLNTNLVLREKLDNLDTQVFTYALVKIGKSKPIVKYIFGPRTKININDVVYLSQGPLQLGPLIVDNI
jgi:hypothetical protein